ncbi:MAG: HEPN domain-containing protein [Proteobacteria bacterium]|nr:HEPN domain-containing protein [Pseudomonadota bacterium]
MSAPDAADDEIFGFHAQQAVEKSLKAWIAAAGGEYGRTHDLQQLFLLLQDAGHSLHQFEDLIELNPFAGKMRYDLFDDDEPVLDLQTMLRRVVELFAHVQGLIHTP